jgi:hypothetical protein
MKKKLQEKIINNKKDINKLIRKLEVLNNILLSLQPFYLMVIYVYN